MSKPSTSIATRYSLAQAYAFCRDLAQSHYENFPVASRLLPRQTRDAVAVIYAFARQADDIADEGELNTAHRLALLDDYTAKLHQLGNDSQIEDPVFIALNDVVRRCHLPVQLFHDLLSAFRQDITKTRYANFAEVLDYCRRSANPVGRLLLHLHGEASEENLILSDQVCSALQLINFLQDLQQNYRENNRIYLPQDEMQRFGIDESWLQAERNDARMHALIAFQLQRIEAMMLEGAILGTKLNGRFGMEIRLIIAAGSKVLEKLSDHGGNVFARPRLGKRDYLHIVWQSLFPRPRVTSRGASASS